MRATVLRGFGGLESLVGFDCTPSTTGLRGIQPSPRQTQRRELSVANTLTQAEVLARSTFTQYLRGTCNRKRGLSRERKENSARARSRTFCDFLVLRTCF